MLIRKHQFTFLLIFFVLKVTVLSSNDIELNKYQKFYQQFENLTAVENFSCRVENLIIKREIGEFTLKNGQLYFCEPFEDRVFAAVFVGDGEFTYVPPTNIEQQQLKRFYEKDEVNEQFNKLFLLFADSTFFKISKKNPLGNIEIPYNVNKMVARSTKYFYDDDYHYIDGDFTKTLLDGNYNNYFSAQFITVDKGGFLGAEDRLFYTINPSEIEDVTFSRGDSKFDHYWKNTINKFSSKNNIKNIDHEKFHEKHINISQYDISCKIESNLDFSAIANINFSYNYKDQQWIYFNLFSDLEVDSVFWSNGEAAIYTKGDDSWQLWTKIDSTLQNSRSEQSLKIYYHGELLERVGKYWIQLKSISTWFPRSGRQNCKYHLTFNYPSEFKLASVGRNYFIETNEDITKSKWQSRTNLKDASFSIGSYDEYIVKNDTIPEIIIYSTISKGFGFNRNMDREVGIDIENSLVFFKKIFGESKIDKLYVCEHPYNHGQAFPGLVTLAWRTFQNNDDDGRDETFRAHEVAHQWWGLGMEFKTYHDQWLSEAFATYSGLMYMSAILKDNEKFFDTLEEWRERIINSRNYLFGSGQEAGPIWLGYRTESKETKGDYALIIYKKGAWVLHMLRNLMLDLNSMNDDLFFKMLQEFYSNYENKKASTEDFKRICDKYFGSDMQWFFDQWVYGTNIPKFEFSYKYEKTEQNKYLVTCSIKQEDVPDSFLTYVPLLIKFDDDKFVRTRVKITGSVSKFNLPLLPLEPEEIIFNDLNSVLCDFEYEDWEYE